MGFLANSLKEIITESVKVDEIVDAIKNHKQIKVNYESTWADIASGERVIEIYAYGLSSAGNQVIRVYQPYGDTSTKVPSWKLFLLSGITEWKPTGKNFYNPPEKYNKSIPEYNQNGDKSMSVVYLNAKFYGEEPEEDVEIYKTSTEKKINRLKKQIENPSFIEKGEDIKREKTVEPNKTEEPKPAEPEAKTEPENFDSDEIKRNFNKNAKIYEPEKDEDETEESEDNLFKTDTEIAMDNLKKQLENPKRIDLNKFNRK